MMERKRRIPIGQNGAAEEAGDPTAPRTDPTEEAQGDASQTGGQAAHPEEGGQAGRLGDQPGAKAPGGDGAAQDDPLAALAAERDSYLDSLQRLKADFDNYRKRSQRERDEAESRARGRLLVDFLPILDNLGRALEAAEHHEEGKVLDGVRLTHSQFLSLLEKEGVSEVCPLGEPFDPEMHEAMLTQPSREPEGIITAVLERGYRIGDRILRAARVAVSAGPGGGDGRSGGGGASDTARG